jgi:transposase InsO family protein
LKEGEPSETVLVLDAKPNGGLTVNARPRLNLYGRLLIAQRMESGWPAPAVAEAAGVSVATVYVWWRRFRNEGPGGLVDRSCRPLRSPRRVAPEVEGEVVRLRRELKLGPHELADRTGLAVSTCHKILVRHGLQRLQWMDRPTGGVVRRIEMSRPGEELQIDVKQLGVIPPGGGHRVHGRLARPNRKRGLGYDYLHVALDAYSRVVYVERLPDQKGGSCAAFARRALAWFSDQGVQVERVQTDNAMNYVFSRDFRSALAERGAEHRLIPRRRPQRNGKVERFNRTMLEQWAYVRPYDSNEVRLAALEAWLHWYNFHRKHTALDRRPPMDRLKKVCGNYS